MSAEEIKEKKYDLYLLNLLCSDSSIKNIKQILNGLTKKNKTLLIEYCDKIMTGKLKGNRKIANSILVTEAFG